MKSLLGLGALVVAGVTWLAVTGRIAPRAAKARKAGYAAGFADAQAKRAQLLNPEDAPEAKKSGAPSNWALGYTSGYAEGAAVKPGSAEKAPGLSEPLYSERCGAAYPPLSPSGWRSVCTEGRKVPATLLPVGHLVQLVIQRGVKSRDDMTNMARVKARVLSVSKSGEYDLAITEVEKRHEPVGAPPPLGERLWAVKGAFIYAYEGVPMERVPPL